MKIKCSECGKEAVFPDGFNPSAYGWVNVNGKWFCYKC